MNNLSVYPLSNNTTFEFPFIVQAIRFACIPIWSIILLFGLFGNALTFFVLRSRRFALSSSSLYLTLLAITDVLYLLTSLLASLINYIFLFPSEVRQLSSFLCFLTPFLHYTLAYFSVWLLVAVTVERAIWVVLPFRARSICTMKTAKIAVTCLMFAVIIIDVHFFFTLKYTEPKPGLYVCSSTPFAGQIFPIIDLFLAAVLPCTIMLIANILIGCKLSAMRTFREGMHSNQSQSRQKIENQSQKLSGEQDLQETLKSAKEDLTNQTKNVLPVHDKPVKEKSADLTRMLVSINIFFILSVTPLLVYDIVYFSFDLHVWAEVDEEFRGGLIFAIERLVYTLWYTNFAIHFLLYCLSGPRFRAETLTLLNKVRFSYCHR